HIHRAMDDDTIDSNDESSQSSNDDTPQKIRSSSNKNTKQTQSQSQSQSTTASTATIAVNNSNNNNKDVKRLMITKMTLENFKSYAGLQEIGPFHKCFTSVVGPNGSGKSNVIDALLFVFGRRAKQIRLNKVAELVHNSEKHKKETTAKVSVFFQDIIDLPGDDYKVVPGTELVVTRTANKKGESTYQLNGEKSTYTIVTDTLKKRGIDLDNNRFLILQGEVEQIAMMKPKAQNPHEEGLLEYLEEIIGSNRYLSQIEESYKAVEAANEKRTTVFNRLKIVEKEREGLEDAKTEAENYLKMEIESIGYRSIMVQIKRHEYERENQTNLEQRQQLEKKLAVEKEKMSETRTKLKQSESTMKAEERLRDDLSKTVARCKDEHHQHEKRAIKIGEDLKHLNTMIKKNDAVLAEEAKRTQDQTEAIEQLKADIVKNEKESTVLPKKLAEEEKALEKMMQSLKGETAELQAEMEERQKELMPWSKKFSEIKSKVDIQRSEIQVLSKDFNDAQLRLDEATKVLGESKSTATKRNIDITAAKKELEQVKSNLKKAETAIAQMRQEEDSLYAEMKKARVITEELRSQLSESSSRNAVLDRLMRMKETGVLPGIHGRLGDLGAIDKKYDVAISTACPSLDNIVVDTTSTAEKCVDELRRGNLGRATFIILDKIDYLKKQTEKIDTPDNTPRLFDLVKMKDEEMYATAFYYALRDTLVANDLDAATKIAYGSKRYRVVTLDGALIDTSGAMSGGGNKVMRGAMGSRVSDPTEDKKRLAKLDEELKGLDASLQEARTKRTEAQASIEELTKRKAELEVVLPKMEMDIKAAHQKEEELTKAIPALQAQVKQSSARREKVEQLQEKLDVDMKEYDKMKTKVDKIEAEIQEVQNKIVNIGGPSLKSKREKVEQLQQQIDQGQHAITKAHVQIKSMEKSIEKSKKTVELNQAELEENKEKIKQQKQKKKDLDTEATQLSEKYGQAQEDLELKEKELTDLKKERDKLRDLDKKGSYLELVIQTELDDVSKTINEHQEKVNGCMRKFEELNKRKLQSKILDSDPDEPLEILSTERIEEMASEANEINNKIAALEVQLKNSKPNMTAIKEYRKKDEDYKTRVGELDGVTQERDTHRKNYDNLRKNRLEEFMAGFSIITTKLKEMYQMITLGGDAELELADNSDPFSEGIIFSVRPPKKSWKNISNLSGGEKTLSSLSLVFALHHYKPTPLYVMDEIDAALDFRNVSIVARYIQERTKNAQFIIISLRNYMFELADRLVGIYKTENCTKSVTINPKAFIADNNNTNTTSTNNDEDNNSNKSKLSQQSSSSSSQVN
ncbi:hypothetical protein SAMD00019534_044780, partial [Acytostelium subglobosum LB1]|uniref:hypothetical protein n=1 Tax=Acytostelium subglobosum LB1 TaxID=1410327 RepID=UPI000644BD5F